MSHSEVAFIIGSSSGMGIHALTQHMAMELAEYNIRVNTGTFIVFAGLIRLVGAGLLLLMHTI